MTRILKIRLFTANLSCFFPFVEHQTYRQGLSFILSRYFHLFIPQLPPYAVDQVDYAEADVA
jgi:hypothetical protein